MRLAERWAYAQGRAADHGWTLDLTSPLRRVLNYVYAITIDSLHRREDVEALEDLLRRTDAEHDIIISAEAARESERRRMAARRGGQVAG